MAFSSREEFFFPSPAMFSSISGRRTYHYLGEAATGERAVGRPARRCLCEGRSTVMYWLLWVAACLPPWQARWPPGKQREEGTRDQPTNRRTHRPTDRPTDLRRHSRGSIEAKEETGRPVGVDTVLILHSIHCRVYVSWHLFVFSSRMYLLVCSSTYLFAEADGRAGRQASR